MNNQTRIKRLKQLKYMLDNYDKVFAKKRYRFSMDKWFRAAFAKNKKVGGCGTAACALGSACLYQPFRKQGLRYRTWSDVFLDVSAIPKFGRHEGFDAGLVFFGITREESLYLFSTHSYDMQNISRRSVSSRVGKLIERYRKNG